MAGTGTAALIARFGADLSDLKAKISEAKGAVANYGQGLKDVAGTLGLAFGVQQISSTVIELTKLAGQADGVRQAYNKLGGAAQVMAELKAATRGTVSELDLMKAAVQANNFDIPLQQMGSLFEFAYERAKATGQSVDYLVNSIVVGIGRKSPLILDNLGISAVALKEKLGGVTTEAASVGQVAEAVGKIASEAMAKMGSSAETAAEKVAKVAASWENLKEKIGTGVAYVSGPILDVINKILNPKSESQIRFEDVVHRLAFDGAIVGDDIKKIGEAAAAAGIDLKTFRTDIDDINDALDQYRKNVGAVTGPQPLGNPLLGPPVPGGMKPTGTKGKASGAKKSSPLAVIGLPEFTPEEIKISLDGLQKMSEDNLRYIGIANRDFNKEMKALSDERQAKLDQERQMWIQFGADVAMSIGTGFAAALAGSQSFADGFVQVAHQIIRQLEAIALGAIVKNAILSSWNPVVALAAASAGILAVESIFAGIRSGSTAGGAAGSVPASNRNVPSLLSGNRQSSAYDLAFSIQGSTMNILASRQAEQDSYSTFRG